MFKELFSTFAIIIVSTIVLSFSMITVLNTKIMDSPHVYYYQETVTTEKTTTIKTLIMYMDSTVRHLA